MPGAIADQSRTFDTPVAPGIPGQVPRQPAVERTPRQPAVERTFEPTSFGRSSINHGGRGRRDVSFAMVSKDDSEEDDSAFPHDSTSEIMLALRAMKDTRKTVNRFEGLFERILNRLDDLEARQDRRNFENSQDDNCSQEYSDVQEHVTLRKGKTVDPENWGNIDIAKQELNTEAQRTRLEELSRKNAEHASPYAPSWKPLNEEFSEYRREPQNHTDVDSEISRIQEEIQRDQEIYLEKQRRLRTLMIKKGADHGAPPQRISSSLMSPELADFLARKNTVTRESAPIIQTRSLKPSDQVPPDSLLGRQFRATVPPQPSVQNVRGPWQQAPLNWAHQTPAPMPVPSLYRPLAPTLPDKYNGSSDVMKYLKYTSQCARFVQEARLPPEHQVVKCADALEGKAYKFYSTLVAMDAESWSLERFFKELFDYCFPPDFRLRQRKKLDDFLQRNMTVAEYAAELTILIRIVGNYSELQRVDKLWNGLRSELQTALWKEGLDYTTSTWDQVIAVAQRHEVANQMENINRRKLGRSDYRDQTYSQNDRDQFDEPDERGAHELSNKRSEESPHHSNPEQNDSRKRYQPHDHRAKHTHNHHDHSSQVVCYNCDEPGHLARDCPKGKSSEGNSHQRDGPQATKSFNVEVAIEQENQASALADTTQGASDMDAYFMEANFGAIDVDYFENDKQVALASLSFGMLIEIPEGECKLNDQTFAFENSDPYPEGANSDYVLDQAEESISDDAIGYELCPSLVSIPDPNDIIHSPVTMLNLIPSRNTDGFMLPALGQIQIFRFEDLEGGCTGRKNVLRNDTQILDFFSLFSQLSYLINSKISLAFFISVDSSPVSYIISISDSIPADSYLSTTRFDQITPPTIADPNLSKSAYLDITGATPIILFALVATPSTTTGIIECAIDHDAPTDYGPTLLLRRITGAVTLLNTSLGPLIANTVSSGVIRNHNRPVVILEPNRKPPHGSQVILGLIDSGTRSRAFAMRLQHTLARDFAPPQVS